MAYTIDPYAELERYLPVRTVSTIRMLFSGDSPLSPGEKIRLSAACSALGKDGNSTGLADIVALKGMKRVAKGTVTDAGVRFYQSSPRTRRTPWPPRPPRSCCPRPSTPRRGASAAAAGRSRPKSALPSTRSSVAGRLRAARLQTLRRRPGQEPRRARRVPLPAVRPPR